MQRIIGTRDGHEAGEDCLVGDGGGRQDRVNCHRVEEPPSYCCGSHVRTETSKNH